MKLTREQIGELRSRSPEAVYQAIRDLVREEFGMVDRDEMDEALEGAIDAGLLEERDIRRIDDGY
jgi:hypothetical protein